MHKEQTMNEAIIGMVCGGLGLLAFFIAGVVSLVLGIRNRRKGAESENWPVTDGIITKTWVSESTSTDEDGWNTYSYTPEVEYQYQLGANTFTSKKISFGSTRSYGQRRKAQKELEAYPINGRVRVYYNPNNPSEAILIRGKKGTMLGIILGVIFIIISICVSCGLLYTLVANA